ncbi:MAG: gas vesicle protein GvpD P-loop domain-containing protein [Thermoplasmata archaeon]
MISELNQNLNKLIGADAGYSLIIKGPPGSGKTTFALSLLESLLNTHKILYFSTRIGDVSLYQQFPWLKKIEKNIRILVVTEQFLSEIYKEEPEEEYKEAARKFLKELNKKREVGRIYINELLKDKRVPEIKHLYREINSALPEKSIIVIDSLEGITGKYNINEAMFAYMIQNDLVESADATVIFVSEKESESMEDYVVDGIINISYSIEDGRRIRKFTLKKLRGGEINTSSYAFTLDSGRFYVFQPLEIRGKINKSWRAIPEKDGMYSTGIKDLDKLLGGGIRYGSFFNIQVEGNVLPEAWRIFETPIIINFFSLNYGVFAIPTPGYSYDANRRYFSQWIPGEMLDKNTCYIDYSIAESKRENVVALGGMDPKKAAEIHRGKVKEFIEKYEKTLFILNYDFLEYSIGPDEALKNIFANLTRLKSSKSIALAITKPGQKINKEIKNIADYVMILTTINGATFIYGIKPRTIYYGIEIDEKMGFPYLKLVPMV